MSADDLASDRRYPRSTGLLAWLVETAVLPLVGWACDKLDGTLYDKAES